MAKKASFFWASYADLMISLFFIMLVLFVLSVAMLRQKQKATEEQLKKIEEIQSSVKELPDDYFEYQPAFKRHTLRTQIQFKSGMSNIDDSDKPYLLEVGRSIETLINKLKKDVRYKDMDIRYLVVIEGMASKDNYPLNYELSYERALALYRFWQFSSINFDPGICEVQIAGSGTGGVGRHAGTTEYKNQRFLIQVVPKIGEFTIALP